ncbi:hypothetical protein SBOR_10142 [Sclerotinia borealis F-4128]|uniref:Uncharacterized protein n=1 Tax=Sclerotinia borealis (strain F-4128) TaxID=1432307 RepID=W9BY02_SCLBF|nr:hypothetical protein SBOR_10142 [Sclerotinia borealis F-4128]
MGSCLSFSSGPSPKTRLFTPITFGRSTYVQIEKQDDIYKLLLLNEEDYYSDEEDVGLVPTRRYRLSRGRLEMQQEGEGEAEVEGYVDVEESEVQGDDQENTHLNKTLPSPPETSDEPPFEGMVKVWSEKGEGRWMWPRGFGVPVVVSEDYLRWREQRDERVGGSRG